MNGIPCRVKVIEESKDGKTIKTRDLETFYFATFRKCKKLAELVRKITKIETRVSRAERLSELAEQVMSKAETLEEVDAAAVELDKANAEVLVQNDKRVDTMMTFVREGIKAAGYPAEEADRLASYVSPEDISQLVTKSKMGAGYTDFFVVEPPSEGK